MGGKSSVPHVRAPAVAGLFYPDDANELSASVKAHLGSEQSSPRAPKALIVPHAGYIYSGPVAGKAYAALGSRARLLRRIVLIGPSHRVWFDGMAVPSTGGFTTPLGTARIAFDALERLRALPAVLESDRPHALEHSLEVQVPFLQQVAPDAEIIPIVTGDAAASEVEAVLESVWGGAETLILISSDLSHYHAYTTAQARDTATAQAILDQHDNLGAEQACGYVGINGLTRAARRRGMHAEILDLRNSGDTAGDKHRVVGYGAFGYYDA